MSLSEYKDTFGKPGEGIHGYRIANVAILDVALTGLTSYAIARSMDWNFLTTFAGTIALGEAAHYAFGVQTSFMTALGVKVPGSEQEEKRCPLRR